VTFYSETQIQVPEGS